MKADQTTSTNNTTNLLVATVDLDAIQTARANHRLMQSTTSAIEKAINHESIQERNTTILRIRYHPSTINISLMTMSLMILTCLRKKVLNLVVLMNSRQEYF